MGKMIVELEWDDELGESWMNIYNLELCLYGNTCTKKELLSAVDITQQYEIDSRKSKVLGELMVSHNL